jgi:hypothetical protein
MEASANIGESYIALREISFKLRSSFLTVLTAFPANFLPLRRKSIRKPYYYDYLFINSATIHTCGKSTNICS